MKAKRRKKLPVILEPEEVESLMRIPNKRYFSGKRNLATLSLMLNMGLRVSEVSNLKPSDVNLTKNKLRIVGGKGGIDRDLIIPFFTSKLLKEWWKAKPKNTKYFFTTIKDIKRTGKAKCFNTKKGSQFKTRNISYMIKKYSKRAGIKKNISPHSLRHTFGTTFIRQGGNVMNLKTILGHVDISTTQIYITLALKDVEKAMAKFEEFKI
ncbi:Tyrosine recombinase XerD [subsurface metagenome]